jgi:hypothetical protein
LKATESILKGLQAKYVFIFFHLVVFFYSLGLEFVAPSVGKMYGKFSCRETCLVVHKNLCIHFLHFWFFNKIFMHNYIHMWKTTTTMKNIIIWIIQCLSLNFIPFRFCIWKIANKVPKSYNEKLVPWLWMCLQPIFYHPIII